MNSARVRVTLTIRRRCRYTDAHPGTDCVRYNTGSYVNVGSNERAVAGNHVHKMSSIGALVATIRYDTIICVNVRPTADG